MSQLVYFFTVSKLSIIDRSCFFCSYNSIRKDYPYLGTPLKPCSDRRTHFTSFDKSLGFLWFNTFHCAHHPQSSDWLNALFKWLYSNSTGKICRDPPNTLAKSIAVSPSKSQIYPLWNSQTELLLPGDFFSWKRCLWHLRKLFNLTEKAFVSTASQSLCHQTPREKLLGSVTYLK